MSTYYTYVYLDPRKPGRYEYGTWLFAYEPFYVGKGTKNRYKEHLWEANTDTNRNRNPHKKHKINKIRTETGGDPIIVFPHTSIDARTVCELERCLVCAIGRLDQNTGPLTNLTDGGEGTLGKKQSLNQKQAVSIALKGKPKTERHIQSMKNGNYVKRKHWKVTDPDGDVCIIGALADFCTDHGLAYREMMKVAQHHAGNTKFNRASLHRGWKCEYYEE